MKTLSKAFLGAAMLIGTAVAVAAPAAAQPYGYGGYGYSGPSYGERGTYGDPFHRGFYDNHRRGTWRWDPILHRRVWVPYRYSRFDRWRDRDYGRDRFR